MGRVANNIAALRENIALGAQIGLEVFAGEAEQMAKDLVEDDEYWWEDTGSAKASITGWNPELSKYNKNFDDEAWQRARSTPGVSRYSGFPYFNTPENYQPVVETKERGSDYEAYLSMFVKYATRIHRPGDNKSLAEKLFLDIMGIMEPQFHNHVTRQITLIAFN